MDCSYQTILNLLYLFVIQPDNSLTIFVLSGFCLTKDQNYSFFCKLSEKNCTCSKLYSLDGIVVRSLICQSPTSIYSLSKISQREINLASFFNLSSLSHAFVFPVSWKRIACKIKKRESELSSPWWFPKVFLNS